MTFTTRFAPSPTGPLHLGHAYSALLAHDAARAAGGRFLLRIEDIDQTRARPEFEAAILSDLAWLGVSWETPVRRQSDHFAEYAASLERLNALGVLYRSFHTRRELSEQRIDAPHGDVRPAPEPPRLSADEEEARLAAGEAFAWRLSIRYSQDLLGEDFAQLVFVEREAGSNREQTVSATPGLMGDVVLARKDAPVAYHLAVVHDDALQGVTHVIRGEDLRQSTHVHVLLQRLLGLPTPTYQHHRLLTGPDGKRYSKRDGALSLASLRAAGDTPGDIRRRIGLP